MRVVGVRADLLVEATLVGAELEHVAEHRDAAAWRALGGPDGGRGGEIVEGGAHRHRVGVVAVIDQQHAAWELGALTSTGRQHEIDVPGRSHPDRLCGGHRRQEVRPHVGLGERDIELERGVAGVDAHVVHASLP